MSYNKHLSIHVTLDCTMAKLIWTVQPRMLVVLCTCTGYRLMMDLQKNWGRNKENQQRGWQDQQSLNKFFNFRVDMGEEKRTDFSRQDGEERMDRLNDRYIKKLSKKGGQIKGWIDGRLDRLKDGGTRMERKGWKEKDEEKRNCYFSCNINDLELTASPSSDKVETLP